MVRTGLLALVVATIVVAGCASRVCGTPELDTHEPELALDDRHVVLEVAPALAPFSGIVLERTSLTIAGFHLAVSGTVDVRTQAIDLVGRAGDLVATVRGTGGRARACVTGHVGMGKLVACAPVPGSLAALGALRSLDVTWQLAAPEWRGHGTGTMAWRDGELVLDRGHAELVAIAGRLAGATITTELHGALTHLALDVVGEARTHALALGGVTLRELALPFELRVTAEEAGKVTVVTRAPLVARGRDAAVQIGAATIAITQPVLALARADERLAWPPHIEWSADDATWHDVQIASPSGTIGDTDTLAWASITGASPLDAGAGAVAFSVEPGEPGRVRITSGWLGIAGGVASIEPVVVTGAPLDLVVHLDGVELDHLLGLIGQGRVEATGVLDGRLVVRVDGAASSVVSGALHSHGLGSIRVADAAWRTKVASQAGNLAFDKRIVAALADFEYGRLDADLGTRGPELQINLHGQGNHVPQELDLVVNLNGIRDTLARSFR